MADKLTIKFYAWMAILIAGLLLGVYSVINMFSKGHGATLGTNDDVAWGIFIVGFIFLVGIGSGVTIIGLLIHAFGRADFKPLANRAVLFGLLSLMGSMLFIMLDVGNIATALLVPWVLRNTTSMFIYTSLTYYVFGLLMLGQLAFAVKVARWGASGWDRKMQKWLAIASFPFALLVLQAADGALFSVVKVREYWNSALLPAHFALTALVTGTAVIILLAIVTARVGKKQLVSANSLGLLGKLLAYFVAVTVVFDLYDLLVLNYSELPEGMEVWRLLTGPYLTLYALNIGGLIAALVILVFKQGRRAGGLVIASFVALLAVVAYRYNLVIVGQQVPLWSGQARPEISYAPSSIELSIAVGIVALVLLLYTVLTKILPMEEAAEAVIQVPVDGRQLVSAGGRRMASSLE